MEYYDKYQFTQIDENTMKNILLYSNKENKIYKEKRLEQYIVRQHMSKKTSVKKYRTNQFLKIGTISKDIAIQRNVYKLKTEFEKELLMLNIMFPDDLDFLKLLKTYDKNNLIHILVEKIDQIDEKYEEKKCLIIKKMLINNYITHNKEELMSIILNFKVYSDDFSLTMLYTRLLQIKTLNKELYNQIFEIDKAKTLIKK